MQVDTIEAEPTAAHKAEVEHFALTPSDEQAPATRGQILRLQQAMRTIAEDVGQTEHRFTPGLYIRTYRMPAGALVVGKTHRHAHPLFIESGHALIVSEFGRQEVRGGDFSISKPGAKRVVIALEDTVFTTVHANRSDTQDVDTLESLHIVAESPAEIEAAVQGLLQ